MRFIACALFVALLAVPLLGPSAQAQVPEIVLKPLKDRLRATLDQGLPVKLDASTT